MSRVKMLTLGVKHQDPGKKPEVYIVRAQRQDSAMLKDGFKVALYSHENVLGDTAQVAISDGYGIKVATENTLRKALKLARERLAKVDQPWYESRVKEILNA